MTKCRVYITELNRVLSVGHPNHQVKSERGKGNEQYADLGEGHSRKKKQ